MNKRSFFFISTREKQIIRVVARKVDPVISPRPFRIGMVFVLLPRKQQKRIALLQDDFLPLPIHLIDERPFSAYNKVQRIIFPRTPLDLFVRAASLLTAPQDGDPVPFMVEQRFSVDIYFDITHFSLFPFRFKSFCALSRTTHKGSLVLTAFVLFSCFIIIYIFSPSIVLFQKDTIIHLFLEDRTITLIPNG